MSCSAPTGCKSYCKAACVSQSPGDLTKASTLPESSLPSTRGSRNEGGKMGIAEFRTLSFRGKGRGVLPERAACRPSLETKLQHIQRPVLLLQTPAAGACMRLLLLCLFSSVLKCAWRFGEFLVSFICIFLMPAEMLCCLCLSKTSSRNA